MEVIVNKSFLKWWLLFCLQIVGVGFALYYDIFNTLLDADKSFISILILSIYVCTSLRIGYKTKNIGRNNIDELDTSNDSSGFFQCETFLVLGMIGTVIGFIMAFSNIHTLNVGDMDSMRSVLQVMGSGIGTALWTTLVGLVCNLALKLQLINYENGLEADTTDEWWPPK
jgi:hypothetical protein